MSIVEYESWSLDASETGESTKCPWVGEMGLKAWGVRERKRQLKITLVSPNICSQCVDSIYN